MLHRLFLVALATSCALAFAALIPLSASASVIHAVAMSFTGDPLTVSVKIDDETTAGSLTITLEVQEGSLADLRGFFAQVSDESLLAGMMVTGSEISAASFDANNVVRVGGGNNVNGGGSPCPCDLGVEIGSPGIGRNDIQSVTFVLSHVSESLDVSLLNGQLIGVRATSVGSLEYGREGSSKLVSVVPEPSTALLMMLGLTGLASAGARLRP